MFARKTRCRIIDSRWLAPQVLGIRFLSERKIRHEPGQFLSIAVPIEGQERLPGVKRAYTLASPPPDGSGTPVYELCVKVESHGAGSRYLAGLKPGDEFTAFAPYGDFYYSQREGRNACFIATGSGIAPFRSMILSREFQENPPLEATLIFGARSEKDILYAAEMPQWTVKTIVALTQPRADWNGFHGRVTDYLRTLPNHWPWHRTDFYICGNSAMARDVLAILREGHGVPDSSIHREIFFSPKHDAGAA